MKKILILSIAMIFIASYSITAQNTATDTKTATVVAADTKVECQDKENTKSSKQLTGFNFNKSNKYAKSSCSSKAKSSSSCSSKAKSSSCCSTTKTKTCGDKSAKACCTKDNSKAMNKNAAEKVRTAIANNEISPKEGEERIASLNKKSEKSKK